MRGGVVRSLNHERSTHTTHNDHRLAPSELMRPACRGSRGAPIGGSGAGGSSEGMIAGSGGTDGMRGLRLKCVSAAGRCVHALPAAYAPISYPLQRLQKGADRRLGGRGIAGGHDRRLGRHGGHEWASAEVRKGGWAACRCATGGIRANFASSAEAPKGYGSVVRQPEVRVGAYTRAWPVSGARAGCSPSQDALRGRAYMPTLSILGASIGGFASRRETGVSQARWWPAHRLWVRAHATRSCASLLSRLN